MCDPDTTRRTEHIGGADSLPPSLLSTRTHSHLISVTSSYCYLPIPLPLERDSMLESRLSDCPLRLGLVYTARVEGMNCSV